MTTNVRAVSFAVCLAVVGAQPVEAKPPVGEAAAPKAAPAKSGCCAKGKTATKADIARCKQGLQELHAAAVRQNKVFEDASVDQTGDWRVSWIYVNVTNTGLMTMGVSVDYGFEGCGPCTWSYFSPDGVGDWPSAESFAYVDAADAKKALKQRPANVEADEYVPQTTPRWHHAKSGKAPEARKVMEVKVDTKSERGYGSINVTNLPLVDVAPLMPLARKAVENCLR